MWLIIHAGIKINLCQWKGPEEVIFVFNEISLECFNSLMHEAHFTNRD